MFDIPSPPTGFAICFGQGMDCIVRVVRKPLIELLDISGGNVGVIGMWPKMLEGI